MKKFALILLSLVMVFSIAACSKSNDDKKDTSSSSTTAGTSAQLPNPVKKVESAEDFKAIGITLDAPSGAKNAVYSIIDDKIAEVDFEMNGKNYALRASAESDDFSGLYGKEEKSETIDKANNATLSVVSVDDSQYCKITWTDEKTNFCIFGIDGADEAQVKAVYETAVK